ncbi:DUF2513 domain-containing protein [Achromobacter xylosoxidans]|jgi:hypothetical protein|uniref:DUF2513 domain-containing protein n=2 Tax=Achromobacter TaxID=222 RepID=A0A1D8I922_9BURK|nr:DUF2513 domain-containing protein [Achromobacter ruhlandii]AKP89914.1 hypothetical protein Axylo_2419 [Achromobacter xylosoxidans]ALX84889.1 hypothetical protein APT56_17775 [Achromobacter denitrificans]AMG46206.1 DUF2513 domain-containing protein [Achromobacter xylosoxidans]AOU92963.1 uncharacterized protein AruCF_2072 [Achromobacter ruhlandii]MCI1838727.1 DUF2513 domain-containing protein [Achromobacter ruhlandii]
MQRDFDLVVTILGALRDAPGPNLSTHDIKEAALAHEQGLQLVAHHLDLLADAGLVKQVSETAATAGDTRWRITWKGYDALEQDEEDEDDEDFDAEE